LVYPEGRQTSASGKEKKQCPGIDKDRPGPARDKSPAPDEPAKLSGFPVTIQGHLLSARLVPADPLPLCQDARQPFPCYNSLKLERDYGNVIALAPVLSDLRHEVQVDPKNAVKMIAR